MKSKQSLILLLLIFPAVLFFISCNDEEDNIVVGDFAKLRVERTNPADGSIVENEEVDPYVEFEQQMDLSTTTVNTVDTSCSGTIQLSSDDFLTCIRMSRSPRSDADGRKVYIDPDKDQMKSATTYKFKILSGQNGVKALTENYLPTDYISTHGFVIKGEEPSPEIILYSEGTLHSGMISSGTRNAVDALCQGSSNKPSNFSNYRAFISFTGDSISGFTGSYGVPSDAPIKSKTDQGIANNWADLLDGTIQQTLSSAGVLPSGGDQWWSGSNSSGMNTMDTCTNWSTNIAMAGTFGYADQTGANWIDNYLTTNCGDTKYLLCIAY